MATDNDTKPCPPGQIRRRGYTRKFKNSVRKAGYTVRRKGKTYVVKPTKTETRVASTCIKDAGKPGKGTTGRRIGPLRTGDLIKYGYSYRLPDSVRRKALEKAVKVYGALKTYHKLDAVAKLSVRVAPDASKIFAMDRDWIRETMMKH